MLKIFDYIKKIFKYILSKLIEGLIVSIIVGIIAGIVAGLVVTYLFSTPEVSLIDTNVIVNDDKIDILYSYENRGKSAAINISSKCILLLVSLIDTDVIANDDKIDISYPYGDKGISAAIDISSKYILAFENLNTNNFIEPEEESNLDRLEVGDNFSSLVKQLTIRNKSNFIILSITKYEDVDRFRQFINEKLLNNSYTIYKWAFYDYKEEKKYLSAIPLDLKEKYKKEMLKRIKD